MNIIKNRYLYYWISLLVISQGLIFMVLNVAIRKTGPIPLGIDFTGGSLLEVKFEAVKLPSTDAINAIYTQFKIKDAVVQPLGTDSFSIRSEAMDDATKGKVLAEMNKQFG